MTLKVTKSYEPRSIILIIAQCLIAFGLVIRCNSMWITLETTEDITKKLAYLMIFAGIIGAVFASRAIYQKRKLFLSILIVGLFAVYLLIYLFITDFAHKRFLRDLIIFLALVFYYFLAEDIDQVPKVLIRYEYIVTVIAVLSIVCWLVFSIFRIIPPSGEAMTWWNGTDHYTEVTSFYGIYYEPQYTKIFGTYIMRNCSFFTEAPMASLHFSVAFLINLFLQKKTSVLRGILVAVAILSTFSLTGYVVLLTSAVIKLLLWIFHSEKFKGFSKTGKILFKVMTAVIILAVALYFLLLMSRKMGGESWRIRSQDMYATISAWLDKPIFGNGVYNFDAVKAHFPGSRATYAGFSCTTALGTILADGGLMFAVLYLGAFVCAVIKSIKNREYNLLFFAILILFIFTLTIVAYDYIILFLFLFLGAYKCKSYHYLEKVLFG